MRRSLSLYLFKQTDKHVLHGFTRTVGVERKVKSRSLIFLNEIDRRKLYAKEGYSCLLRFLVEKYCLSESTALKKIQVARLARKYPFLYRDIEKGTYSLTVLSRISKFVNNALAPRLFSAVAGKSVRETEDILVKFFPRADVEEALQKSVTPLGEDRIKVQFMAGVGFLEDLEKAKALLSHRYPQGRLKDILGLALRQLVKDLEKSKGLGSTAREIHIPRGMLAGEEASAKSRHIPEATQRQVWSRDLARCQQPRPDGTVCGETRFLEIDHIHPFALGGGHNKQNLRLLCWAHNALRAEQRFGKAAPRKPEA